MELKEKVADILGASYYLMDENSQYFYFSGFNLSVHRIKLLVEAGVRFSVLPESTTSILISVSK